jgi:hypothetical protein
MTTDTRLKEIPPLPKGAEPKPLDCRGPGQHSEVGYRCFCAGERGCNSWVCSICAGKKGNAPRKEATDLCYVCQVAVTTGCSIPKALKIIAEQFPDVAKGKVGCASTKPGAPPCRKCLKKKCAHAPCSESFRTHKPGVGYCSDLCRVAARREADRQRKERLWLEALAAA